MLMVTLAIVGVGLFIGYAILRAPSLAAERKELARREAVIRAAEQLSIANRVARYAQEHPEDKEAQEDAETEMLRAVSAHSLTNASKLPGSLRDAYTEPRRLCVACDTAPGPQGRWLSRDES